MTLIGKYHMFKKRRLYLLLTFLMLSCTAPFQFNKKLDYTNIELSYDRTLCGTSPLPFWFHLNQIEIDALQNIEKAKSGDPGVLLTLALIASGNVRKEEDFRRYHEKVSHFVDAVRPEIENEHDFWKKGFLVYKRMRKAFFVSDSSYELAGYEFGQSQLSVLLDKGIYNCISSAMLYCILGRWFDMQMEGVLTRGHAFVLITAPDGRTIEVETTSRNGYDWIHNEEFYRRKSSRWFNLRGISNQTYDDYAQRQVVKPYRLITHNMKNQHTDFSRMSVEDVHRLIECRAYIDDTNTQYQKDLVSTYRIELSDLEKKGLSSTIRRFYNTTRPRIALMLNRCGYDSAVVTYTKQLCKQMLKTGEREIDTLLASDTGSGVDSVYGLFTSMVREVHRLFPKDTTIHDLTMKLSRGIINKVSNRILVLIEQKKVDAAAFHYGSAESFVREQLRLFPDVKGIAAQSNYFEEKKQLLLFAQKNFEEFLDFSQQFIEKFRQDTSELYVTFKNALHNTFAYIKYCTENKEFEKAEQLIEIVAPFTGTDKPFAQNIQWALGEAFHVQFQKADWAEAIRICKKQIAIDVKGTFKKMNSGNLQVCYQNWTAKYYNEGNWPKAREILINCVNDTGTTGDECSSKLRELEKQHNF